MTSRIPRNVFEQYVQVKIHMYDVGSVQKLPPGKYEGDVASLTINLV